jgi:hypothetical protein
MNNLVTVQIFTFPTEAHLAQLRLESNGIACFLKDETTIGVINLYSNALGGVKLQVEEKEAEKAREILTEAGFIPNEKSNKTKIEVIDESTIEDTNKCPFCGSENIDTVVHPSPWVILFYFLLSVIFPIFKSWEKCYDCQKEWKYKKSTRKKK